ncbi:MAG TPA: AAA family ATPase [Acidimicrobiales bacterium]|nr:AAA family ATPase [Acidimicrobiales bacterium]
MSTVTPSPGAALVGRDTELSILEQAVQGALGGTLHAAFVEGEGGMGKSTLLRRTVDLARDAGFTVFLGEADELEQGRPFRSILEAMGCVGPQTDSRRAEIVRLLGAASDTEAASFRLIDAFDDLVEAEALEGPILLAIDDLQWADPGTVGTLGSVSRRLTALPILIIGCFRPLPRGAELAALLRSAPATARAISLGPLGEEAVEELTRARVGGAPGPKLRRRLSDAGGTPFYVHELLESLLTESRIRVREGAAEIDGEVSLGANLRATILRRLSELSPEDLEILRGAAILGAGFRLEELAAVTGLAVPTLMQPASDLRVHGVLEDAGEKLRFRHDLIREAIYEDMGEPVRRSMHRRAARALTELGLPANAIAPHLIRSALPGDLDAADTLLEASNAPGVDTRSAATLLAAALEINPEHPRRAALESHLAVLLTWQGRADEAISRLLPLVAQTTDGASRLHLMLRTSGAYMTSGRAAEAHSWGRRASALAREFVHSRDSAEVRRAAEALFNHGDPAEGLALSERALELARGSGDAVEAEANNQCSWMSTVLLRHSAALRYSQRALELMVSGTPTIFWRHHAWALADLDRIPEAKAALAVASDLAETNGMVKVLHGLVVEGARLEFATGRWDDALLGAQTAAALASEFGPGDAGSADDIAAWIRYRRTDDCADLAAPAKSVPGAILKMTALFDAGDVDTAAREARQLLDVTRERVDRRGRLFESLPTVVRICLAAGATATAQLSRDTAVELAQQTDAPSISLAALRCRALLDGDPSAARQLVDLARVSPRKVIAAEALEDASVALPRQEALEVLTEARAFYGSIGATRDESRVNARLAELDAAPVIQPRTVAARYGWDALTAAESEVVRLAAEGLTNREIGSRLFISHRTVASHLSNVFAKLGLRSRVDLAREASLHLGS